MLRYVHLHAFLVAALVLVAACGEGDFDQRVRIDIEEIRDQAFDGINSNPATGGHGKVVGFVNTGGPVRAGRVVLYPVSATGELEDGVDDQLGNGLSSVFDGSFSITLRREYRGPLIISVRRYDLGGFVTSYTDPAHALSDPDQEFSDDDELLGFVQDFPNAKDAVVVSPLTTLAVERARWLGGLSSGNLSIASRQVGAFFGMQHTRENVADNLSLKPTFPSTIKRAHNLACAMLSQLAADAHVATANVWLAMRLDVRDNGEFDGSIGFIPGSVAQLPDLGAENYLGSVVLEGGYLDIHNPENLSGYDLRNATEGSGLRALLDDLDTARSLSGTTLQIEEMTLAKTILKLQRGERASLGLRAFDRIGDGYFLLFASDGPSVLDLSITSDDPDVASIADDLWVEIPDDAEIGAVATISARVRPDGVTVIGDYDRTWQIMVQVVR